MDNRSIPRALTEAELERNRKQTESEAINEVLRKPKLGEKRIFGQISEINCKGKKVLFTVQTDNQTIQLQSKNFSKLLLRSFTTEMRGKDFGCNTKKDISAVLIYNPTKESKDKVMGDIISIEFVPKHFVLVKNEC